MNIQLVVFWNNFLCQKLAGVETEESENKARDFIAIACKHAKKLGFKQHVLPNAGGY
jgi:hypothetical protein